MIGALFETMVVAEWVKAFYHRGEIPELYYWRSKSGLEVDLIVDRNGILNPVEIKATSTLFPGHVQNLEKWKDIAGDLMSSGIVIANITEPFNLKGFGALPWNNSLDG